MDIASSFEKSDHRFEIADPHGKPTGIFVSLVGPSDAALETIREEHRSELNKAMKRGAMSVDSSVYARHARELTAHAVTKIEWGDNQFQGKQPKASPKVLLQVFETADWFFNQVISEFNDQGNFYRRSEPAS